MTKREAINLIDIIRMGYICDPQECGEIETGGTTYEGELCDIFKCYDYHDACVMAIEALEAQDHKCENCNHRNRRRIDFDKYWCLIREIEVYDDMSCTDWSKE